MRVIPRHVVEAASKEMNCEVEMIVGRCRMAYEKQARRLTYHAARELGLTASEIGRHMGRDHSTIIQVIRYAPLTDRERILVDRIKHSAREIALSRDARLGDHLQKLFKVR